MRPVKVKLIRVVENYIWSGEKFVKKSVQYVYEPTEPICEEIRLPNNSGKA